MAAATKKRLRLDAIDRAILGRLQTDGRTTNADLARLVGISPASTLERVRKLERSGLIRGYIALLDASVLGKTLSALVTVTLREHGIEPLSVFKDAIQEFGEVRSCWHTAGEADFTLLVRVEDIADYERFVVERLSAVPSVGRIQSNFILDTVKDDASIPLDES